MNQLESFLSMLCGQFDNKIQLEKFKMEGITNYPFAELRNTHCNDKIIGLPNDFKGTFVLKESTYTMKEKTNNIPHLFLIIEEQDAIKLVSYEIPDSFTEDNFSYENLTSIKYVDLKRNETFSPIHFKWKNDCFYGKSVSIISSNMKFKFEETLSAERLLLSETIEVNGKRTFGFDLPIVYRRCESC